MRIQGLNLAASKMTNNSKNTQPSQKSNIGFGSLSEGLKKIVQKCPNEALKTPEFKQIVEYLDKHPLSITFHGLSGYMGDAIKVLIRHPRSNTQAHFGYQLHFHTSDGPEVKKIVEKMGKGGKIHSAKVFFQYTP